MFIERGFSIAGLLGGLLDGDKQAELAAAIREALAFAQADHEWVVTVKVRHDEGDAEA